MFSHETYMQRCVQLAQKGLGLVSPNPMVGCVVVYQDEIIGEGFHQKYGEAHAEVNAIQAVKDKSLLKDATVYVSLEPCNHYGKTPPCADLLVKHQVKRVVVGCKDPFSQVYGTGIQKLKDTGTEVVEDVLKEVCIDLNKRFFTYYLKKRPYIILKWAESADGFLYNKQHAAISGIMAQTLNHQWRSEEDSYLIGKNTLITDNPQLNTRLVAGKNPIRIVLDSQLESLQKGTFHFYNQKQTTMVINQIKDKIDGAIQCIKINDTKNLQEVLDALYQQHIQSVVVEGGAALLNSFINANLMDEIRIFKSHALVLGNGIHAPEISKQGFEVVRLDKDNYLKQTLYNIIHT
jgi:diaminohydroxyphosphoribosylaminopyrimidine deaminase / 5-amino-6-(5-phosphoribosylamino)uracil reductase